MSDRGLNYTAAGQNYLVPKIFGTDVLEIDGNRKHNFFTPDVIKPATVRSNQHFCTVCGRQPVRSKDPP